MKIKFPRKISLTLETMQVFGIKPGDLLLSIRSSNIAICLVVKGPLVEVAKDFPELEVIE